jgi:Protein of unknown function (DUF2950)
VVAVAVEEAAVNDMHQSMASTSTKTNSIIMKTSNHPIAAIIASSLFCVISQAAPDTAVPPAQKQFDTPQQAADSLIQAAASFQVSALKEILGPDSENIVASEDPVMDKERTIAFAEKAKQKQTIEIDPENPNHATLAVGEDAFPMPIPIVKKDGKWSFDTEAGREEILNRRIGANELDAIEICRGYVEAQHEYASEKRDGAIVHQYAQRVISTPGKQDGLAWKNADGTWEGPVGEEIAKALEQGYSEKTKPQPYHGYLFKVLKGQGPAAPLGQLDFVIKGAMIGGFALAAAPAGYQVTGVKTFIVSHTGVVYEKDLGPDTLEAFRKMELFNPDDSWKATDDEW